MKTIKVLGQKEESLKIVSYGTQLKNFSVSDAIQFATDRSTADYQYVRDLQEQDVVELIFEDNIRRWVTVAELEQEYQFSPSRGEDGDVLEIPQSLPASGEASRSRGAAAWILKGMRVLKYDPMEKLAKSFAEAWDEKLMPLPGLFSIDHRLLNAEKPEDKPAPVPTAQIDATKKILLFLHGTFSSTKGSFAGLTPQIWTQLRLAYGNQVYGFDHFTLSKSPIQNALELVRQLPANATLHLVTHSRGGLIGELLARTRRMNGGDAFDQADRDLAASYLMAGTGNQDLIELSDLLKAKNIQVERFVRIACPARGTTLASGRLDRWLELIVNVTSKLLEPTAKTIFGILTDLLLDFKKQGANPGAIPGLAAMVPESSFIRMINRADVLVDSELYVIAGDVDKNDILGRLAIFFADLFYFEDHDLVVQTRAMYGGAPRPNGLYFFDKGSEVNHFHYFSSQKTSAKILEALTIKRDLLRGKGFRLLAEAYEGNAVPDVELVARSYQKRSNLEQPVVYIVPGIMGTHLSEGSARIWLDLLAVAAGKIPNLKISNRNIQPLSLVAMSYGNLLDYLSSTHEVIPFPYDWRLSILDEARRFAQTIEAKLNETKQPIRIIGHSMGGLVTRAMISLRPDIWERICKRDGARFIMLGTPNKGSHKITRLLLGREQILRTLAIVDIRNSPQSLLQVITRFPGVLQLLPMNDDRWDFMDAQTWEEFPDTGRFTWVKPQQEDLDLAKNFQAVMNAQAFTPQDPVVYVAGISTGAPVGVQIDNRGELQFLGTNEGDGTVTWQSGILPELQGRTWYMAAQHGDLANHKPSFSAIYDLLQDGRTTRLSKEQPAVARGVEKTYMLREETAEIYPVQADLEQIVLGTAPIPLGKTALQPVKVSVVQGNFSYCNGPIAVGHYEGDGIFSAEKYLDYLFSGRLTARQALSRYPGPEGTAEVIFNKDGQKPAAAIIVGLGKAGELSPNKLTQSFANAMREYAILAAENQGLDNDGGFAVSTLLIGAGGMGISVAGSVDAILRGVSQANKSFTLLASNQPSVHIREIQFIELYQDQAIQAAKALCAFDDKPEFAVEPRLRTLRGGVERLAYDPPPGWWSRIYVRTAKDDSLIFTLPSNRARAEEAEQGVQKSNIDALVTQAVKHPQWDQDMATAMFELMIPNPLKGSFRDLNDILLVLDPSAAHYPWELIYDRRTGQDKPLAVQVGLIRQFTTANFQERVVDVQNKSILVVGNPKNLPPNFANLPGAEQEAHLVADKFRKKFEFNVVSEICTESISIMSKLFANDYRILHLAGHGVFNYKFKPSGSDEEKTYTGMVLGNEVFLTAAEIANKMDIPELVFINCCHLAQLDDQKESDKQEFNKLAASLSEKLIKMGVKAVVAAGWAVDDAAAMTFADVFYEHLLNGSMFGEAVREARLATYELHKDRTNTWAAYQCYGDPNYRLMGLRDGDSSEAENFVDVREAVVEIQKRSIRAKSLAFAGIATLQQEVIDLQKRIEWECSEWLENPRLQEALGEAFSEVFLFDEAIDYYERAVANQKSGVSIKAVEQLANLNIRKAVADFANDPNCYDDSKAKIDKQIKKLKSLMKLAHDSSERWSMIGSGYKRLAQISAGRQSDECYQALLDMEKAYEQARKLDLENPYPVTNLLTAKITRLLRENNQDEIQRAVPHLIHQMEQATELARVMARKFPDDFWASIAHTDISVIECMIGRLKTEPQSLSEKIAEDLSGKYQSTWKHSGSARELNSVIENYAFLAAVLDQVEPREELPVFLANILSSLNSVFRS